MDNMRWKFTPNEGYQSLLQMVNDKNYFVLTSNVDGCFERSGFDPTRIYTPQGEWTYLQCKRPCQHDSVFPSRPYLDVMLANLTSDGLVPEELVPKCPRCGSEMFGNVRGGSWFLHHHKYNVQNQALETWMESLVDSDLNVVILEIGAGFNTPTVTRFPAESFARNLGDRAKFCRINPTEAEVPEDLRSVALEMGWEALNSLKASQALPGSERQAREVEEYLRKEQGAANLLVPNNQTLGYTRYFGHFDWKSFLCQLKR
jgi:NAD-dependent SIR2 family protein deacetylase